jgi:uncharacterized protein (DUF488 family)
VRSIPRSRTNPQFNADAVEAELLGAGILYRHFPELGGRRGRKPHGPSSNLLWANQSFRNYADYAQTAPFQEGLERLHVFAGERHAVIMCAEAVWWRCHRRIIADYLLAEGETVLHILGPGTPKPAQLTPGAYYRDGIVTYPGPDNLDALKSLPAPAPHGCRGT